MGAGGGSYTGGTNNEAFGDDSAAIAGNANTVCDDYSVIAGGYSNSISTGGQDYAIYSFIGGGNQNKIVDVDDAIGAGSNNQAGGEYSAIGAGVANTTSGSYAMIGSGSNNSITTSPGSFIGSGDNNSIGAENVGGTADAGGGYSVVSGGYQNKILGEADGYATYSSIGGGYANTITGAAANANAAYSSIVGGYSNAVTSEYASILGGGRNAVSGEYATIAGGFANSATGPYATIVGGDGDTATGTLSLAGGYRADAVHNGSFVWSDYTSGSVTLKDSAANQFVVRASGGVQFYSNEAMTSGVKLAAGSGTFSSLSDRNAKTAIVPLDDDAILTKVAALPVSAWSYSSERGVRHLGPMAQDFYAAFGVGEDDRHITAIDEDGVALASIKALHREVSSLRADAARKDAHIRIVDARLQRLTGEVERLLAKRKIGLAVTRGGSRPR